MTGWKALATGETPRLDPRLCEVCEEKRALRTFDFEGPKHRKFSLRLCAECGLRMAGVERD